MDHCFRLVLPVDHQGDDDSPEVTLETDFHSRVELKAGQDIDLGGLGKGLPRYLTVAEIVVGVVPQYDLYPVKPGGTIVLDEYAVLNERRIPGRIEGTVIAYLNCIVLETSEEYHRYLSVLESIGFVRQTEDAAVATAGREGLTCPICSNS